MKHFLRTPVRALLTGIMIGIIFCGALVVIKDSVTSTRWYMSYKAKAAQAARLANTFTGSVTAVNGTDMTIQTVARPGASSSVIVVHAASSTLVIIPGNATPSQRGSFVSLSVGNQVTVTGTKRWDGSVDARTVISLVRSAISSSTKTSPTSTSTTTSTKTTVKH